MVEKGLEDLKAGRETEEALLVSMGAFRLRDAGIPVTGNGIPRSGKAKARPRIRKPGSSC
jgi:hypothetical protein